VSYDELAAADVERMNMASPRTHRRRAARNGHIVEAVRWARYRIAVCVLSQVAVCVIAGAKIIGPAERRSVAGARPVEGETVGICRVCTGHERRARHPEEQ